MNLDLDSITVEDFKSFFFRDFPYLPVFIDGQTYNQGNIVYWEDTSKFYKALENDVTVDPSDTSKWEISTEVTLLNYILDEDIEKVFQEAKNNFNQSLFSYTEDSLSLGTVPSGTGTDMSTSSYFDASGTILSNSKLTTIDLTANLSTILSVSDGDLRVTLVRGATTFIEDLIGMDFTSGIAIFNVVQVLNSNLKSMQVLNDDNVLIFSSIKYQEVQIAYFYITAFYLVKDWNASFSGVNSKTLGITTSKSVGNVSESYDVPEIYKNDPFLSYFYGNEYGRKYLSYAYGKTIGHISVVKGVTQP